jgi:hypothetical protein
MQPQPYIIMVKSCIIHSYSLRNRICRNILEAIAKNGLYSCIEGVFDKKHRPEYVAILVDKLVDFAIFTLDTWTSTVWVASYLKAGESLSDCRWVMSNLFTILFARLSSISKKQQQSSVRDTHIWSGRIFETS